MARVRPATCLARHDPHPPLLLVGDPWRDATVSADGTNFTSTAMQPIALGDGFHVSDLYAVNGEADPTIASVQAQGLAAMKDWLADWEAPQKRSVIEGR